MAVDHFGLGLT